jgi:hypothetical protein
MRLPAKFIDSDMDNTVFVTAIRRKQDVLALHGTVHAMPTE